MISLKQLNCGKKYGPAAFSDLCMLIMICSLRYETSAESFSYESLFGELSDELSRHFILFFSFYITNAIDRIFLK